MWRREDPGDLYGLPTSHERAIRILIERREFASWMYPSAVEEIEAARESQAPTPGTMVYIWSPKRGGLDCYFEGERSKTRIPPRILAGTRAKVLSLYLDDDEYPDSEKGSAPR